MLLADSLVRAEYSRKSFGIIRPSTIAERSDKQGDRPADREKRIYELLTDGSEYDLGDLNNAGLSVLVDDCVQLSARGKGFEASGSATTFWFGSTVTIQKIIIPFLRNLKDAQTPEMWGHLHFELTSNEEACARPPPPPLFCKHYQGPGDQHKSIQVFVVRNLTFFCSLTLIFEMISILDSQHTSRSSNEVCINSFLKDSPLFYSCAL